MNRLPSEGIRNGKDAALKAVAPRGVLGSNPRPSAQMRYFKRKSDHHLVFAFDGETSYVLEGSYHNGPKRHAPGEQVKWESKGSKPPWQLSQHEELPETTALFNLFAELFNLCPKCEARPLVANDYLCWECRYGYQHREGVQEQDKVRE
jgi:hypothetical protein